MNVIKTTSHLYITASSRRRCIKKDRRVGWGEDGMWQLQLMLPRGHRAVDANASDGE